MLTELAISLLFTLAAITATAGLLKSQWERTRCAYQTFEATHARLVGAPSRAFSAVRVQIDSIGARGEGRCGQAVERVELPWLQGQPNEEPL